jgi:hypothetical protein
MAWVLASCVRLYLYVPQPEDDDAKGGVSTLPQCGDSLAQHHG